MNTQTELNTQSEQFLCENCGATMVFDINGQQFKCPQCDEAVSIESDGEISEHDFEREADRAAHEWADSTSVVKCETCGGEIVVDKATTVAACDYCGSSHVLVTKQEAGMPPEGLVTFKIDERGAVETFRKWVQKKFWAPNALKYQYQEGHFQPVYEPYWTYDADTGASYTAEGGKVYYVNVKRDGKNVRERRVRWYPVSGSLQKFFDDVLVSAGGKQEQAYGGDISFNLSELEPFTLQYLSGYHAEKYTVNPRDGFERAKDIMKRTLENMASAEVLRHYDEVRSVSLRVRYSGVKFKHILLPFWLAAYHYGGKLFNVAINGQSGRVFGQYPKSKVKIAIASVIGAIILALVIYFAYTYS